MALNLNVKIVAPEAPPVRKSRRSALPPTRGQVQVAAEFFARALGKNEDFAKSIFGWGIESIVAAWAVVRYALLAARAQKVVGVTGGTLSTNEGLAIVKGLEADLQAAHGDDVGAVKAAREATPPVPEAIAAAEKRVLKGIPRGDRPPLCPAQRDLVVATLAPMFQIPSEVPFAKELPLAILGRSGRSQGFGLWLIEKLASAEDFAVFMAELEALQDESAPEDEADEDGDDEDGENDDEAAA